MTVKRRMANRRMTAGWRTIGAATLLAAGTTLCQAQQQKGPPNLQAAAAQLQQQQMAMQQAQTLAPIQSSGSTANPRQTGTNPPFPSTPGDETSPIFQDAIRTKRNDERQKRLEVDTQRLLDLANRLKSEVALSGAESMNPEMLRQMDEIEKLAKSVKDRMRN